MNHGYTCVHMNTSCLIYVYIYIYIYIYIYKNYQIVKNSTEVCTTLSFMLTQSSDK